MNLSYTAIEKRSGRKISGIAVAENIPGLARQLASEGKLPLKITEAKDKEIMRLGRLKGRPGHVKEKEVAVFTRQLAATLSSGLLLSDALETVSSNLENRYFEKIIESVRENVRGGMPLSTAMMMYSSVFPQAYVSVIKSGEATGQLALTLKSLAQFLENSVRIKEKIRAAFQYPSFVLMFAGLIVFGMVVFIVPKFKEIFAQADAQLPGLTRMVVGVSDFILTHLPFLGISIFLSLFAFFVLIRLPVVRYWKDVVLLKLPIIGKGVLHKALVSRFAGTLGFLLDCGVPIGTSLEITAQVVSHQLMAKAVRKIRSRVLSGYALSDAIREQKIFPLFVAKMCVVGERTGNMAGMLEKTAQYYDEELENTIQKLMVLIEPILMSMVGVIVGIIVIALYLPIFKVSTLVR